MARRDTEEFTAFVVSSQAGLRRTAFLICGDWQLASDYVQEALIRVYRHWPKLHRDGRLHSYARKALVSTIIDDKRRRASSEVPVEAVADRTTEADAGERGADRDLLTRCLAGVPARQRACLVLRFYEDLPVHEVATLLGTSEGTVKSQTARGLETLRTAFAHHTDDHLTVTGRE